MNISNDSWVKAAGKLVYEPKRPDLRKSRAADDWWLVLDVPCGIAHYYNWWVKKEIHLDLQLPAWNPHITLLDGRRAVDPKHRHMWKKHAGKWFSFEYNVNIEQHWKFWTLPVRSRQLQEIRSELGFSNEIDMHLTIGRMK